MQDNYTDITIILDSSGSMYSTKDDTIGGIKNFVKKQKKLPGKARLSVYTFASYVPELLFSKDLEEVLDSDFNGYSPSGGTALLDAIGIVIDKTGERLCKMPQSTRPGKVMVVTASDGQENSSTRFNFSQVEEKITHQTDKYDWDFVYIGANQDAIGEASKCGIGGGKAMNFAPTSAGISNSWDSYDKYASKYRSLSSHEVKTAGKLMAFDDQDRALAVEQD